MELNEQTLEQILTRQREEYQRHLDEVRGAFRQGLDEVRADFRQDRDELRDSFREDLDKVRDELRGSFRQDLDEVRAGLQGTFRSDIDAARTDLRQYIDKVSEEDRLHMGVLTEDLRDYIKFIAEGHVGLREQIIAQREEFQRSLTVVSENLGGSIKLLFETLKTVQHDIEMIKTDIEIMKAEFSIIRSDLKEKMGRDELAVLEARVAKLERVARASS